MTSSIYRTCLKCGCTAQFSGLVEDSSPVFFRSTVINSRTSMRIAGIRYEFRYRYFDDGSKECWRTRMIWHCLYCDYEWNTLERASPRGSK